MKILRFILVFIWASMIFYLIAAPLPDISRGEGGVNVLDKIAHFFLFGILAFLIIGAISENKNKIYFGAGLSFLYATFCEIIQHFISERSANVFDLLAGALGILFFVLFVYAREYKKSEKA